MKILCNRGDIEVYKIDHNYKKVCTMNLYCCQSDLFENTFSYFHQFICYCCTTRFSYPFDYQPLQNE